MKKSLILFFVLASIVSAYSQGSPPPPDGGSGPGTVDDVSIGLFGYPLLFLASFLGVKFFSKS